MKKHHKIKMKTANIKKIRLFKILPVMYPIIVYK